MKIGLNGFDAIRTGVGEAACLPDLGTKGSLDLAMKIYDRWERDACAQIEKDRYSIGAMGVSEFSFYFVGLFTAREIARNFARRTGLEKVEAAALSDKAARCYMLQIDRGRAPPAALSFVRQRIGAVGAVGEFYGVACPA